MGYPTIFASLAAGNQPAALLDTNFAFALAKDGSTAPTAAIPFFAGTVSAPGVTFSIDLATGLYLPSGSILAAAVAGADVMRFHDAGAGVNYVDVTNAVASSGPTIAAKGSDTNIDMTVQGKGSGGIIIPSMKSSSGAFYEVGTFTATLTGCTTAPTYTVAFTKIGNHVTLMLPNWTGTSNAVSKTLTGMPAGIRPSGTYPVYGMISNVVDNTVGSTTPGSFSIASTGVITMYKDTLGGAWTNAGTATGLMTTITYTLA